MLPKQKGNIFCKWSHKIAPDMHEELQIKNNYWYKQYNLWYRASTSVNQTLEEGQWSRLDWQLFESHQEHVWSLLWPSDLPEPWAHLLTHKICKPSPAVSLFMLYLIQVSQLNQFLKQCNSIPATWRVFLQADVVPAVGVDPCKLERTSQVSDCTVHSAQDSLHK